MGRFLFSGDCSNFTDDNGVVIYTYDYYGTGEKQSTLTCNVGYKTDTTTTTCVSGSWSPKKPTCTRKNSCHYLKKDGHNFKVFIIV